MNDEISYFEVQVDSDLEEQKQASKLKGPSSHLLKEKTKPKDGGSFSSDVNVKNVSRSVYYDSDTNNSNQSEYFCYDPPLFEETGVWIPVSVPPMSETERKEWNRGLCLNGGYTPDSDMGWEQFDGEDREMTMWNVVLDMLLAARGKVSALASGDARACQITWLTNHLLLEQTWKEMSQTLTEANFSSIQEILEAFPPKWLADSAASACMLCNVRFHPIMCSRHHCRFCGGLYCNECSKGRRLLPPKFRKENPERVCDVCCVRLESVQSHLMDQVSRAAQSPTNDLTDLSTLRSWLNFPWGQSMEYEIYKAANTIRGYDKVFSDVFNVMYKVY